MFALILMLFAEVNGTKSANGPTDKQLKASEKVIKNDIIIKTEIISNP